MDRATNADLRRGSNQTPTMAYDPAENSLVVDGSLVGKLNAMDPDSTRLTYTATEPAHGDVAVNPDGTFTYTTRRLHRPRLVRRHGQRHRQRIPHPRLVRSVQSRHIRTTRRSAGTPPPPSRHR